MSPAPVTVRKATAQDSAGILACLDSAFAPYRNQYTPEGFLDTVLTPETLQERMKSMFVFVAVGGPGAICGTIACGIIADGEGHLRGMAVLPEYHGSGVAEELLRRAESHLADSGCKRITLDTTAPLERAIRFYQKHGYEATGRVEDFFGMPLYEYAKDLRSDLG